MTCQNDMANLGRAHASHAHTVDTEGKLRNRARVEAAMLNKEAPQGLVNTINGFIETTTRLTNSSTTPNAVRTVTESHDGIGRVAMYHLHDFFYSVSRPWKVSANSAPIFRAESLSETKLEGTRLSNQSTSYQYAKQSLQTRHPHGNWHTRDDITGFVDRAMEVVMEGKTIFISGIGGTGNSHTMKEMVKQLPDQYIHVKIIAKCHVAALNAEQGVNEDTAMTAQAFVHYYNSIGGFTEGALVLEELMTMGTGILHAISSRKRMGVQSIVLGDRNQHPAIGDEFNGMPCDEASLMNKWRG
ncbi:AAA family ATPase [bacterium]|nr:AAA family ATPase [bacterium]